MSSYEIEINQEKLKNIVINIIKKERENLVNKKHKDTEMPKELVKIIKEELKLKY